MVIFQLHGKRFLYSSFNYFEDYLHIYYVIYINYVDLNMLIFQYYDSLFNYFATKIRKISQKIWGYGEDISMNFL